MAFRDRQANGGSDDDENDNDSVSEPDLIVEPDPLAPHAFVVSANSDASDFFQGVVDSDLLAALFSLNIGDEGNQEVPLDEKETFQDDNNLNWLTESFSSSPLPQIELDFGDENFLIDSVRLEDIFVDPEGESDYSIDRNIPLATGTVTQADIDQSTEDLYRDLMKMSLQAGLRGEGVEMDDEEDGDDFPAYPLFCLPCTPHDEDDVFGQFSSMLGPVEDEVFQANADPKQVVENGREFAALLEQYPGFEHLLQPDDDVESMQQVASGPGLHEDALESADPGFQEAALDSPDPGLWHEDLVSADPSSWHEALASAEPFITAFGLVDQSESNPNVKPPSKERACYAHRETIFGVTFSECGKFCATASQDSTVCIWDVKTNSLLTQLKGHSKAFECLRVAWASQEWASHALNRSPVRADFAHLLATSGADGVVKLWACADPLERKNDWECVYTLDHSSLAVHLYMKNEEAVKEDASKDDASTLDLASKKEDDKPQTYTLQFIDHWKAFNTGLCNDHVVDAQNSFLMTSSDDFIHFWEIKTSRPIETVEILENNRIRMVPDKIDLMEVMSIRFGEIYDEGYGVSVCSITGAGLPLPPAPDRTTKPPGADGLLSFGGERNPEQKVYVFDAAYCKTNGLLGVALSDGSLRLINGRGICISVLNLPGCQSHLTSFCWDSTGTRLATSVATGHLIVWKVELGDVQGQGRSLAACNAIMEGGHQPGRPLFGSRFCGEGEKLVLSWSVDGSLCLWDSHAQGNVHSPIAVLRSDVKYPIYAVEVSKDTIAVCGGEGEGGFIGIPVYLTTFGENDCAARTGTPIAESSNGVTH